jgi:acrylyl-CoA reductase (NADPH)
LQALDSSHEQVDQNTSLEKQMSFQALMATSHDGKITTKRETLDDDRLMPGDVTIDVEWSTVNYKDGLALSGALNIIQTFPMIPGIDLAGIVALSSNPRYKPGDRVVLNSWAASQTHFGGYSQRARVNADWLVKLPDAISTRDAMAIGTAGYTAMLCVMALEHGGVFPKAGDILVTGASGGVGSIAIALLSRLGYRVIASTGRLQEEPYLKALGASDVIDRSELAQKGAPIAAERWAGAVDSVGSITLANILSQTRYRGVVTSCGLAQGVDLPGSVLPFILRNLTLAGIDSVNAPYEVRVEAWSRLARDLDLEKLAKTVQEIGLDEVVDATTAILLGKVRGRTVVNVNR